MMEKIFQVSFNLGIHTYKLPKLFRLIESHCAKGLSVTNRLLLSLKII